MVPTLVFLVLMPILIALGMWQLGRAEQKRLILAELAQRQQDTKLQLRGDITVSPDSLRFRKVSVSGVYDVAHQFLLDNQIVAGKAGYFVLTPLLIGGSNKAVLVNRGWVPAGPDRSLLPDISLQANKVDISGRINRFPGIGLQLSGAEKPSDGWPSRLQLVYTKVLEKKLGYALFDFQVQLDEDQVNGFKRDWHTVVAMPPEKHVAYAMQWFGLALTLIILFLYYSCKKVRDE